MSGDLGVGGPAGTPLTAVGDRVEVRPPTAADAAAYAEAVTLSERRLADFAMPNPHNLPIVLENQGPTYRTFMVHARDPEGSHGLVGRINVANVVEGAFRSATVGYDSYDPYAGRGLFSEGLSLAIDLMFADPPLGMGLHRVEANIQPSNHRSAGLVRSLGFVHEGFSRHFLHLPGPDGRRAWRDHERFTMLSTDWPAVPYRPHGHRRIACVVSGAGAYGGTSLAVAVAAELGVPLYSSSTVASPATLFELLRASPVGGVVECRLTGPELRMGLARAGFDPSTVPVLEAAFDVSKREVVRHALAVRAAHA
ncbi:GNAT family N-acetyltransferase [Terrabacter sp. GCM10028922]|uniref:GNAT family N-acetyltransferase n=1 Tax=Terrabacter sp. GCM10028922 TaxID=3273428 RepID=UPI003615C787